MDSKLPDWGVLDPADTEAVRRTVEDYFIGWFDGDADRMRRALHPELVKRSYRSKEGLAPNLSPPGTAQQMVDGTLAGHGRETDPVQRQIDIVVDDIDGSIATARVNSMPFREYVHLVRTSAGWRIVDALWTLTRHD